MSRGKATFPDGSDLTDADADSAAAKKMASKLIDSTRAALLNGHAGYQPRSITTPSGRKRRSAEDLAELLDVVVRLLDEQSGPISIRHLFYLTVAASAVEKTERGYQNLKHQLAKWRRSGDIEWSAFSDSTRWYYGRRAYSGPAIRTASKTQLAELLSIKIHLLLADGLLQDGVLTREDYQERVERAREELPLIK